jgi:hypothetical protein
MHQIGDIAVWLCMRRLSEGGSDIDVRPAYGAEGAQFNTELQTRMDLKMTAGFDHLTQRPTHRPCCRSEDGSQRCHWDRGSCPPSGSARPFSVPPVPCRLLPVPSCPWVAAKSVPFPLRNRFAFAPSSPLVASASARGHDGPAYGPLGVELKV